MPPLFKEEQKSVQTTITYKLKEAKKKQTMKVIDIWYFQLSIILHRK